MTWSQLTNWQSCSSWKGFTAKPFTAGGQTVSFADPCDYFTVSAAWCAWFGGWPGLVVVGSIC